MIYNNHFMFKNKINPLLLKIRNILETQKTHPMGRFLFYMVKLDYALPSEPNTSIRSSTDAWIAFTPSAKNLRGSKSFFLSYSASFAS